MKKSGPTARARRGPVPRTAPRLAVAAFAMAFWLAPGGAAGQDGIGLPTGTPAPAVTIEDLDGRPVELAAFYGTKPVLLEFWATWCPVCEELEPRLEAARRRFGDRVEFLLVAVAVNQSKRSIRRHLESHEPPGRILWDTKGRATRAFMAPATSYIVILDGQGRVAYTGAGADQDIEAALARVLENAE